MPPLSQELRPEFVDGLKSLFDLLDSSNRGSVSYEAICARFAELPRPALPSTFLSCIGKVTPASGLITFDRFLAAVQLSLQEQESRDSVAPMGTLYRVQSEGRLAQNQKQSPPLMGINGHDHRRSIYSSNPNLGGANYESSTSAYPHVIMRPKKTTVRSQKESSEHHRLRHPLPPQGQPQRIAVPLRRPVSTNSYNSVASSGLENIVWRNSVMSSSNSDSTKRNTFCEDEAAPRIAKLSSLHEEEEELIRRGLETATRLVEFYKERKETLERRQRLLEKGCVSLDTAVHEQKLNFLRAHVTELNRRMVSLIETSEKGFPTHVNLNKGHMPQPYDDQLVWLHRQNQVLSQEINEKNRQIEELKRASNNFERLSLHSSSRPHSHLVHKPQAVPVRPSAFVRPAPHLAAPTQQRTTASPIKIYDTLM